MPFSAFAKSRSGNFAVIAALSAIPLVLIVGGAIDYSRGYGARTKLQAAVDAAALAVVKSSGFDQKRAQTIATQMILANYGPAYQNLDIAFVGDGATLKAETSIDTTLLSVIGIRQLTGAVSSTVEYPKTRYEIVLVLDTTGSMAGTKLTEMKKAAAAMVDELNATPEMRDRVKIALVPFSTFVNVGADQAKKAWLDQKGKVYLPNSAIPEGVERLKVFGNLGTSWSGCVETRIEDGTETYAVDDARPDPSKPRTLFVPMLAVDEPGTKQGGRPMYPNNYSSDDTLAGMGIEFVDNTVTYKVVGTVMKVANYLFYGNGTPPQGPNAGCDSHPIVPLTNEAKTLKAEIEKLQASGSTNITEGVAWGQRVLSPGEPFTEGATSSGDVKKIMVLLTDGDNTITALPNPNGSAYSSYGYMADGRWNDSYKTRPTKKKCQEATAAAASDDDADDDEGTASNNRYKVCAKDAVNATTRGSDAAVTNAMNTDTTAACQSSKANGLEVYAIRLEVATASSSSLLSNCASDKGHYYDARSAADLKGIFADIAKRIMRLHITS